MRKKEEKTIDNWLAWFAGYMEGKGCYLQRDNHKNLKGEKGCYYIQMQVTNPARVLILKKAATIIGRNIARMSKSHTFAEKFQAEGRPAIFVDGTTNDRMCLKISSGQSQKLIRQLAPLLHESTLKRLQPVLNYKLATYKRCPITGQYRGKKRP
jgi:hypothetical protein